MTEDIVDAVCAVCVLSSENACCVPTAIGMDTNVLSLDSADVPALLDSSADAL